MYFYRLVCAELHIKLYKLFILNILQTAYMYVQILYKLSLSLHSWVSSLLYIYLLE